AVQIAIIKRQNLIWRSCGAERRANVDAALFGIDGDPQSVRVLPIDLVPGRLNFLRDFYRFAAAENVEAGTMRDDHPVFADADSADGWRAETPRNFRNRPQRRLVAAVVLRGVERMFLHKIKPFAQLERGANGLAIILADAEQAVDAVVTFRIFHAAGAHDGTVQWLRGRE